MAEFVWDTLTSDHLADYLTAEWGMDLAIWEDGNVTLIEHNISFRECQPLARLRCPGISNLDASEFTEDFATNLTDDEDYIENNGDYYEIATGRRIGDLADVIRECCRDGDVLEYMDDLRKKATEGTF